MATFNSTAVHEVSFTQADYNRMLDRFDFPAETLEIIEKENLLPLGLMQRLHRAFPKYSAFKEDIPFMFKDKKQYVGLKGFHEIVDILKQHGFDMGHLEERELFIKVYRFMATRHVLNIIDWGNFATDSLFQLVFPQPGMLRKEFVDSYFAAKTDQEKESLLEAYIQSTHPHDGKQKLNKPVFRNENGELEIIDGSQHKYPQCQQIGRAHV